MHLSAMDRYCATEENHNKQSSKYDDVERMMAELFGLCDSDMIADSETISPENRSINNIDKEYSSNQLEKHQSKGNINSLKNDTILEKEHKQEEKKQKRGTEINQDSSLPEIGDTWQVLERDYKGNSNSILLVRNVNKSNNTVILNTQACLKRDTNSIMTNENQDSSISKVQTSCVNSELLPEQTHTSKKIEEVQQNSLFKDKKIRMLTDSQRNSLSEETNSKTAVKRIHSESPESVLTKKMQKMERPSSAKSPAENLTNDIRIFEREGSSEDKQSHNNNNDSEVYWKNITEYTEKGEETVYNSPRQRRKLKRKQDKIKRVREKVRYLFQDCISPNKSESDEDRKIISECLARKRLEFASNNSEFNDTLNDVTTEEEAENIYEMDKIRKRDMSANNNLQDGTESVVSRKSESVNSSDSTICIENRLHDFTDDEETDCNSDKTSITRKRNVSVDTSQEDIGIPLKIQRIENSAVIVNTTAVINQSDTGRSEVDNIIQHESQENQDNVENVNLTDTDMKISTDIRPNLLATKEVNMQDSQENVTSADEDVKIPKDIRPNLTLATKDVNMQDTEENVNSADEDIKIPKDISLILATKEINTQENQDKNGNINLGEKDLKDIRPNLSSIFVQELISDIKENDSCDVSKNITENKEAITKIVNVSIRNPDEDSTNKKAVNDIVSKRSDSSDNYSSTDDDNMSDIEVEIKIKPKSKSRISRKFSLKAPLSAVNTCFKNLNTLKKNPDFLGELFQMNFKTSSENLRHENTNEENGTKNTSEKSSDVNQDITAESNAAASNTQEVMCNSSHTRKDNADLFSSQQQEQSTQNNIILDKDRKSKGANIHVQFDQQTRVTDGNNSESSASDKEKTADKQQKNPPKIFFIDLENEETKERNLEAKNAERIKGKETAAEIDIQSTKSVPESQKQLPKTSSETLDAKCSGGVRVRTSTELGYMWSSNPMNLSMNSDASNGAHSMPSASSIYKSASPYNFAANPAHHPSTTNVPTEIIPPNLEGDVAKSLRSIVGQIYFNFKICRKIIEEKIFSRKRMCEFKICLYRIYEDIDILKMMLQMTNNDDIINYINQYKLLTIPLSINELAQYAILCKNYISGNFSPYTKYSNVSPQSLTDNNAVRSAPISNAQAPQPQFSGNIQGAPVSSATSRTQPSAVKTNSSTVPQPEPNINQSQLSRSAVNPLHSRLPSQSFYLQVPPINISVPNSATNSMINVQQPMRNANYVQGQRMSSMFTVNNNQQPFVNPSTGSRAPMAPSSASNTNNIRTNRWNINASSTDPKKYQLKPVLPKSTIAAASATNRQQQVPSQMSFHVNSGAPHLLTNQNANIQNVYYVNQPMVHTNINAPINVANVTGNLVGKVGFVNPPVNPQMQFPITPAGKNVPQYNVNAQTNFTPQTTYGQNIFLIQNQQQQNMSHLNLPIGTSIHLIGTKNNVSQNAQPLMPNRPKRPAGIPETQTRDRVPNKTLFAKPQRDAHQQGATSVHTVSQEPSVQIPPKTSVSQKPSVSQNVMSHTVSQADKTILISQTNPVASLNKSVGFTYFDVSSWTTRDQIRCRNQLHYYLEYCLNKQPNSETLRLENRILIFFYSYLKDVLKLMNGNYHPVENFIEKRQNVVSEKASTVPNRQSVIKSSCNEIQSNNNSQSNENNLICDKVQEKESLEESVNPDASINSKSTIEADSAMKKNVESSHLQSTSRSIIPNQIEDLHLKFTNLLNENTSHPLKMSFKMNSASTVEKQSENINTSLTKPLNIPKENLNVETSHGIFETKAQDDKIARPLAENSQPSKSSSLDVSQNTLNFLQETCTIITENRTISNDNTKDKEIGKSPSEDLNDKRLSESSFSAAQNTLNLLQNDKTKDDNVEGSDNAKTSNLCNISDVTVSNSNGGNEKVASQVPCNAEVQDKEVDNKISMCNLNNKISNKNSQDKTRENVQENSEKSIFTDTPRASSTPFILDEKSGLLIPTNRTSKSIAQTFTFELLPDFFTREDPANEQINDSGKTHDDSFESLGCLHIDESAEKSEEEQDDEESFFGKDKPNTSQDLCFSETNRESAKMTLYVDNYEASLSKIEENSRKVNENLLLKEMQAEETPDVPEDISSTKVSTSLEQSINTVEDIKKNQAQMDTHSSVKAINELFKHVSDDNKHCAKPRTSPTKKSNIYKAKIHETAVLLNKNATSNVSPAKSEDENSGITLNITNVSSIPSFLFETIDNEVFQDLNYTLIEMEEKNLLDVNDNPKVNDSVLLNEMKEQLSDNPEVPNLESLNEVKGGKPPNVSDTSEIFPILLHAIQIKENPEAPFILNDVEKEEELDNPNVFVDINDKTEIFDSTPFEEVKLKDSWSMDDNPRDQNIWKNEMEEEKLLENPELYSNVIWFKQEEDQSLEVPDTASDNMEKEKLSNINDNSEEPDEIEDRPCLRCKRKSTVYCQDCLEAPYCSKRCFSLHWRASHHKQCKGRYKSAIQPDQIICID